MTVIHIVMFHSPASVSKEKVKGALDRASSLVHDCLHPDSGKPYIKSFRCGQDNSIEDKQDGITHTFIMEFESVEDRDWYVEKDPVHASYVATLQGVGFSKVQVTDFVDGVY